jgi:hypothetical protein
MSWALDLSVSYLKYSTKYRLGTCSFITRLDMFGEERFYDAGKRDHAGTEGIEALDRTGRDRREFSQLGSGLGAHIFE